MRERIVRGLQHGRMIREPQVVVGAEIDQFMAAGKGHHGTLGGVDHPFALEQSGGIERLSVALQAFAKFLQHLGP